MIESSTDPPAGLVGLRVLRVLDGGLTGPAPDAPGEAVRSDKTTPA